MHRSCRLGFCCFFLVFFVVNANSAYFSSSSLFLDFTEIDAIKRNYQLRFKTITAYSFLSCVDRFAFWQFEYLAWIRFETICNNAQIDKSVKYYRICQKLEAAKIGPIAQKLIPKPNKASICATVSTPKTTSKLRHSSPATASSAGRFASIRTQR